MDTMTRERTVQHLGLIGEALVCDERLDQQTVDVLVVPDGEVHSVAGTFVLDGQAADQVIAAFGRHGVQLVIDFEHQTLGDRYESPTGLAPAAGWIKALRYEPGRGIVASVNWTDRARQMIRAGEYRYLSPVTVVEKKTRRVVELHSAALTNKPAIPRMERLAAKETLDKEAHAMPEDPGTQAPTGGGDPSLIIGKIMEALGVTADTADLLASLNAIYEAIKKGGKKEGEEKGTETAASKAVLAAVGLKEDADENAVVLAINTLRHNSDAAKTMAAKVQALEQEAHSRRADEVLAPYIKSGQLNPQNAALVASAKARVIADPADAKIWLDAMVANPPTGKTTAPSGGKPPDGREAIIAKAGQEWDGDPKHCVVNRAEWVNGALREAGKMPLTEEEAQKLVA